MPNTLVHVGIQGLLTRAVAREADFKWVCLGCVIPDLPWILHRAVRLYGADVINSYDLRLYAVVQSSLFLSLVLCGSAAMFSSSPRRVFSLLSLNAVAHLVLDALETKWANGVLLFAPFSWQLLNVGLFWPDSGVIVAASVFGFGYLLYIWWSKPGKSIALSFDLGARAAVGCGLLAAYLLLPFFFVADSENANNHYVAVLRDRDHRTGKYVEFDKHYVVQTDENTILRTFGGEKLVLLGSVNASERHISVRGRFVDNTTVKVEEVHLHSPGLRDSASKVGLFLIAGLWLGRGRRTRHSAGA